MSNHTACAFVPSPVLSKKMNLGIDLPTLVRTAGYLGLAAIVFTETGLLVGFFLPGDSLLFTAGFLASQGYFDIHLLALILFVAAVVGNNTGYSIGYKVGPRLFKKKDSIVFKDKHLERSKAFFDKHGPKAVILAQFVPVIRTFTPVIAGVSRMPYRRFLVFNAIGAFFWAAGVTYAGYYLGRSIPNVDHYLLPIIALIILVSVVPSALHLYRDSQKTS